MSNYIVIGASNDPTAVRDAVFGEIYQHRLPDAHFIGPTKPKGILLKVRNLFIRARFRKILPPRIRLFWELKYSDLAPLFSKQEKNYLIFCPVTRPFERISPMLLRALRKNHPECPKVVYLIDGVERIAQVSEVSVETLLRFFDNFDAVYTYDRTDAEKYRLPFIEIPLWISPEKPEKTPDWELYFCGRDKNRSALLLDVYDHLDAAQLRCNYRISSPTIKYNREGIHISGWTPYKDTVDEALRSNCILEILAENNFGATLRYKEAVVYNKKLLTNNPEIVNMPYYDARWMRYFEKASDIDLEWLGRVENVDYGYRGDFSAAHFLHTVESMINAECP